MRLAVRSAANFPPTTIQLLNGSFLVIVNSMIYDALFLFIVLLYFLLAAKIVAWRTLSLFGFDTELPFLYLKHPLRFEAARSALFLFAVVAFFLAPSISGFVAVPLLFASWYTSGQLGRRRAFSKYRSIMREMVEFAENNKERQDYLIEMRKTDKELLAQVEKSLEMEKELRSMQTSK